MQNGTFTYTPSLNYNGPDMAVVSICDAGTPMPASCVNDTIFITVNPINDAPVLDNENISTNEDVATVVISLMPATPIRIRLHLR